MVSTSVLAPSESTVCTIGAPVPLHRIASLIVTRFHQNLDEKHFRNSETSVFSRNTSQTFSKIFFLAATCPNVGRLSRKKARALKKYKSKDGLSHNVPWDLTPPLDKTSIGRFIWAKPFLGGLCSGSHTRALLAKHNPHSCMRRQSNKRKKKLARQTPL